MTPLLEIKKISKSFASNTLFNEASFNVGKKQKIGVIGRNGAGKTTLFKMITGEEPLNSGSITIFDKTRIGYLEQQEKFIDDETVIDFLLRDSKKEKWECSKIAGRFQLKNELLDAKINTLSGGFQMRVKLTAMLLRDPNLLLLDEPTNHLDLSTLLLLEEFLKTYNGSYLIISHDKAFLRNTCTETLEVDQGKLYHLSCSLDEYLYQQDLKMKTDERYNKKIRQQKKHLQKFVDRFRYKASKATQAQSKLKQINKLSETSIRQSLATTNIQIPAVEKKKGVALRVEKLFIGYGDKVIAGNINFNINRGDHIAILGNNGEGKSTFLKTINAELPKINGDFKWTSNNKIGYYAQHITKTLNPNEQIGQFLERKAGANVANDHVLKIAANFLFYGDDIKKSISVLSGGEKARLCIAGMLLQKCNVLLFDEPTNHLDFETVEMLAEALSKSNATILFISHNRDFIHSVADIIIEVGDGKLVLSSKNYEEYLTYLYSRAEIKISKKSKTEEEEKVEKELKRLHFENQKKLKNELRKIIKNIEYNKALEQKLLREYEDPDYIYSKERDMQVAELKKSIFDDEIRQLEIEEEIENTK